MIASLLTLWLSAAIPFHDTLHRFWERRGTETAALEAKLLQHITAMRGEILFEVFLYLRKAYDALDRERALELLDAYGVGHRTVRLLRTYWDQLIMVAKAYGYFRRPFKGYQVVTQGDPLSPKIFNVVLDADIHHWVTVVTPTEVGMGGLGLNIIDLLAYFYSEDEFIASTQPERL